MITLGRIFLNILKITELFLKSPIIVVLPPGCVRKVPLSQIFCQILRSIELMEAEILPPNGRYLFSTYKIREAAQLKYEILKKVRLFLD